MGEGGERGFGIEKGNVGMEIWRRKGTVRCCEDAGKRDRVDGGKLRAVMTIE
jgi:hypothetical protein